MHRARTMCVCTWPATPPMAQFGPDIFALPDVLLRATPAPHLAPGQPEPVSMPASFEGIALYGLSALQKGQGSGVEWHPFRSTMRSCRNRCQGTACEKQIKEIGIAHG